VERYQKAAPLSAVGFEALRALETVPGPSLESETLDEVAARWLGETGAGRDMVWVVTLRSAGFGDRAIGQVLSLHHSRVARTWERARRLLLAKALSRCANARHRAALALELAGEGRDVIACVLGTGVDGATAELARIFLRAMREADPPSAQARRCWREQARSRRVR
jgi:hypothetical protein